MLNVSITEFIDDRNNYITNLDPDGFFTYVLINKYISGDIVGFTNSKDYVYLFEQMPHSANCVTYIDMFVTNPSVHTIDQHIITRNPSETQEMKNVGSKLNPNLIFDQDLTNYSKKFPLSTFLFCLLLIGEEYNIEIDWRRKVEGTDLELGHFLLDIDGVLTNIRDYTLNVTTWLNRLADVCENKKLITSLCNYINSIPILELKNISDKVRNFLKENFNTESKDGGYKSLNYSNAEYIERFINFASTILFGECSEFKIDIDNVSVWGGERKITDSKSFSTNSAFSYAIVRANDNNVSYTTHLKKVM